MTNCEEGNDVRNRSDHGSPLVHFSSVKVLALTILAKHQNESKFAPHHSTNRIIIRIFQESFIAEEEPIAFIVLSKKNATATKRDNLEHRSIRNIGYQTADILWIVPYHSRVGRPFGTNTDLMKFGVDHRGQELRISKNTRVFTASLMVFCQPWMFGGNANLCHRQGNEGR